MNLIIYSRVRMSCNAQQHKRTVSIFSTPHYFEFHSGILENMHIVKLFFSLSLFCSRLCHPFLLCKQQPASWFQRLKCILLRNKMQIKDDRLYLYYLLHCCICCRNFEILLKILINSPKTGIERI